MKKRQISVKSTIFFLKGENSSKLAKLAIYERKTNFNTNFKNVTQFHRSAQRKTQFLVAKLTDAVAYNRYELVHRTNH